MKVVASYRRRLVPRWVAIALLMADLWLISRFTPLTSSVGLGLFVLGAFVAYRFERCLLAYGEDRFAHRGLWGGEEEMRYVEIDSVEEGASRWPGLQWVQVRDQGGRVIRIDRGTYPEAAFRGLLAHVPGGPFRVFPVEFLAEGPERPGRRPAPAGTPDVATSPFSVIRERLSPTTDGYEGRVRYHGQLLSLSIARDGADDATTLALTESALARFDAFDARCKGCIAAEYLDKYNDSWSDFDQMMPDGTIRSFSHPTLSEDEFRSYLVPRNFSVSGHGTFGFSYDCGDLFAGHAFIVSVLDGLAFEHVDVDLFG